MKSLSSTLEYEQTKSKQTYYKEVWLSRAEWNGTSEEYEWDTAINLNAYLIKVNNVAWKLDTVSLNEWKVSNVTIELDNREDIFDETKTDGVWNGYLARGSKIEIKAGNKYADSSKELLYVFTGIIDKNVEILPEAQIARLYVSGLEQMLERADAENVSTAVDDENMGTGDGSNKDFYTSNNGVGRIDEIKLDTTVKKVGVDFSVSQLNDPDNPAKITFNTAPTSGVVVYGDYIYWYQDKTFEWLVEELVKEAGITNYDISPVTFPNNVVNYWTQDETSGEFDQGTAQAINYSNDELKLWGQDHFTEINDTTEYTASVTNTDTLSYGQTNTNFSAYFAGIGNAWKVQITDASDNVKYEEEINFVGGGNMTWERTIDLSQWFSVTDTWKIKRIKVGLIAFTKDLTVKWPGRKYGEYGKFVSDDNDCTASLAAFGKLTYSATIPAGTSLKFYTQSADNPAGPWDSEVEISPTGDILSATKRYLRYVIYFYSDGFKNAVLTSITISYFTSNFVIELANFTGLSCMGAIQELGLMPDYEWGVNASGRFFFRSKETSQASSMIISEDVNRIDLVRYDSGWDYIKNHIEATFGEYFYRMNSITEGDSRPHSIDKYGVRKLFISGGNLLGDSNIDIATGICERFYDSYKNPKFRARVRITFLPQLDLSDIVSLPYSGLYESIWDKDFKVIGISLNLESYFIDLDLQEN